MFVLLWAVTYQKHPQYFMLKSMVNLDPFMKVYLPTIHQSPLN